MSLPTITAYPMPREDELPTNTVRWEIDPARAVLLIHDMQQYFLRAFPAGQQPVTDLVANVAALRAHFRTAGVPVVYTAQPGGMRHHDRGLLMDFWGSGMPPRDDDRAIAEGIAPETGDTVFTKWRYTAFHRNGLLDFLREHDRDQLVICGVYAHVGCLMTACDAFTQTIQPFLVADALADFSQEQHHAALRYASELIGCTISTRAATASLLPSALAS